MFSFVVCMLFKNCKCKCQEAMCTRMSEDKKRAWVYVCWHGMVFSAECGLTFRISHPTRHDRGPTYIMSSCTCKMGVKIILYQKKKTSFFCKHSSFPTFFFRTSQPRRVLDRESLYDIDSRIRLCSSTHASQPRRVLDTASLHDFASIIWLCLAFCFFGCVFDVC